MKHGRPLRRSTQLRRSGPLQRRTRLRDTVFVTKGNAKTRAGQRRLTTAKAEMRGRSGGWCEAITPECPYGRHHGVHAHHLLPRSRGGLHEADNLLHVCHAAHRWIHDHPAEATARGLLVVRRAT